MSHLDAVELYLHTVTILLPPAAAREVRAELTAHLHFASLDAQLSGLNAAEAQAKALREAGSPVLAALRFARIYTLGYVLRGALITAALGGAAFAVQSGTHSHSALTQQEARP